jgi:hypothetical protein
VPPDSVRCTRDSNSELLTFGNSGSHSAIIHRTVRCSTGLSGMSAEQRLLRANGRLQKALNALQCAPELEQSQTAHRTVNSDCPVAQKTGAPTVRIQRLGDVAGAPDSVRWRTGLSGTPCDSSLHQTASLVGGAINTPTTLHSLYPSFQTSYTLQEL